MKITPIAVAGSVAVNIARGGILFTIPKKSGISDPYRQITSTTRMQAINKEALSLTDAERAVLQVEMKNPIANCPEARVAPGGRGPSLTLGRRYYGYVYV